MTDLTVDAFLLNQTTHNLNVAIDYNVTFTEAFRVLYVTSAPSTSSATVTFSVNYTGTVYDTVVFQNDLDADGWIWYPSGDLTILDGDALNISIPQDFGKFAYLTVVGRAIN